MDEFFRNARKHYTLPPTTAKTAKARFSEILEGSEITDIVEHGPSDAINFDVRGEVRFFPDGFEAITEVQVPENGTHDFVASLYIRQKPLPFISGRKTVIVYDAGNRPCRYD